MRRRPPRPAVVLAAVALVVAVVAAAARLALDPLATSRTRRALSALDGMRGSFADVEVHVLRLTFAVRGLRIEKRAEDGRWLPFVEVERASFRLRGRELLRGDLVASLDLDAPTLLVVQKKKPKPAPPPGEPQRFEEAPKEGRGIPSLEPLRLDRAQVRGGQVLLVEASAPTTPILRLHEIELVLDGLAGDPVAAERQSTVLTARATLEKTGKVSVFATADPLARKATFAGQGKLTGLRFEELGPLIASRSAVEPDRGMLDMIVRFRAVDGNISGDVRPILKDAGTRAAEPGVLARIKSMLADGSLDVFDEDVSGGADPARTTIPLVGTVKNPAARPVPTIFGVLRNAFVAGLTAALRGAPTAETKERAREFGQARRGASASGSGPRRRGEGQGTGEREVRSDSEATDGGPAR